MKKKIRCYFTDFWVGFDYKIHLPFLLSEYEFVIDDKNPDYLFYSCFGMKHLNYEGCIKIFWSAENIIPDLNVCDYAVCLSDIKSGDRIMYQNEIMFPYEIQHRYTPDLCSEQLLNRKFCNFVYSNNICADPVRERFYTLLSQYKRIDAGGSFLNNMGKRVEDKHAFLKEYKFTIAIENSGIPGYSTEKIRHPFLAQSLPVYWGDPDISSVYNPDSFVNIMDFSSLEEAVEEVIRLDNDDAAYLEKVTAPFWLHGDSYEEYHDVLIERMLAFFRNIFEQPLEKARRRTRYGRMPVYYSKMRNAFFPPEQHLKEKNLKSLKGIVKKMIWK